MTLHTSVFRALNLKARMTFFRVPKWWSSTFLPVRCHLEKESQPPLNSGALYMSALLEFHEVSERGEKTLVPSPNLTVQSPHNPEFLFTALRLAPSQGDKLQVICYF